MLRNSLSYIARGSQGALFFQWRAPAAGAEVWHSGLVPHAGADSRIYREAAEIGRTLAAIGEVADPPESGPVVDAEIAVLWHADGWWALDNKSLPSDELNYSADGPGHPPRAVAGRLLRRLRRARRRPGRLSTCVGTQHVQPRRPGGAGDCCNMLPAAGISRSGISAASPTRTCMSRRAATRGGCGNCSASGSRSSCRWPPTKSSSSPGGMTGRQWSETVALTGASAVARYEGGLLAGLPAVTRNEVGNGRASYVSTQLDPESLRELPDRAGRRRGSATRAWLLAAARGGGGPAQRPVRPLSVRAQPRRDGGRRERAGLGSAEPDNRSQGASCWRAVGWPSSARSLGMSVSGQRRVVDRRSRFRQLTGSAQLRLGSAPAGWTPDPNGGRTQSVVSRRPLRQRRCRRGVRPGRRTPAAVLRDRRTDPGAAGRRGPAPGGARHSARRPSARSGRDAASAGAARPARSPRAAPGPAGTRPANHRSGSAGPTSPAPAGPASPAAGGSSPGR